MFRSFFSFLIVTCFFEFGFAQEVKLTFEDLTKFVREKNQNVAGAVLLKDASQAKTGHLLRSYLPSVRAFTGQETFQTGIYPCLSGCNLIDLGLCFVERSFDDATRSKRCSTHRFCS